MSFLQRLGLQKPAVDDRLRQIAATYLAQRQADGTAGDIPANLPLFQDARTASGARVISLSPVSSRISNIVQQLSTGVSRGHFEPPEWDFSEVDRNMTNESHLRRAVEKYVEQMWKYGFELVGKNPDTVKYVKRRFQQMEVVTSQPFQDLITDLSESLVAYGNLIAIKIRKNKASGGKIRTTFDGKTRYPVAAYQAVDPSTMWVDRDQYGNVRRWKQITNRWMPSIASSSTTNPEWPSYNVFHSKDRTATSPKYFFAMPMAIPVLSDIRALRETEELAILQAIKHSVPRYHARIGEDGRPGTQTEIDTVADYINSLSPDSMLITNSRVKIENLASGDNILDLQPYLQYWTGRIRGGLGLSGVQMGEGDTANRNTANSMASEFQNTTIKFQQIVKMAIEFHIIRELLYEAGYTEHTLTEENMVHFHVPEIDLHNKVLQESHALQLFLSNGITHDELRGMIGRDILADAEWANMYLNLVQIPLAEAGPAPTGDSAQNTASNQTTPANQHGKSAKPKQAKDAAGVFQQVWEDSLKQNRPTHVFEEIKNAPLADAVKHRLITGIRNQVMRETKQPPTLQEAVNGVFNVVQHYTSTPNDRD